MRHGGEGNVIAGSHEAAGDRQRHVLEHQRRAAPTATAGTRAEAFSFSMTPTIERTPSSVVAISGVFADRTLISDSM